MTWTPFRIGVLKLALFSTALAYMAADLWLWHGPIWKALHEHTNRDTSYLMAEVAGEPITLAQFARYQAEQDTLAGRTTPQTARRSLYLMEMVRHTLLRTRTRYNDKNLPPCRDEAEAEVARLASRYADDATFEQALASQGYTRTGFTDRMEARLREFTLLERALTPFIEPGQDDLLAAYESVKEELRVPANREVKHIFLASLNKDSATVQTQAQQLLERLQAGEADFATLAREYSEDERSAPQGGDLGSLADTSQRPLPELPLFGEKAIPSGQPTLAQSRWGWHILLAEDITPARIPSLEECEQSLRSALRSARRELALRAYLTADFREAFNKKRIIFYQR